MKKTAKRALLMSAISMLLCVSMLVGTTFAWFTDSVTSGSNIIAAGNLDVDMLWAEGTLAVPAADSTQWQDASTGAIFNYSLWEPGYTQVRHIKIENKGTLAMKYKVNILANGEVDDLSDVIDVYYVDPAIQVANRSALTDAYKLGTLTDVLAGLGETGNGTLTAGASDTITIAFKMQESAGNEYMGKAIGSDFSIVLSATQLTSENDSFGNDYDSPASNPVMTPPVVLPESGPMTIGDDNFTATLSADLVDDLRSVADTLELQFSEPYVDTANKTITYASADMVDQNRNVVDLEAMGNDKPYTVKLNVAENFAAGEVVRVYHDGVQVAAPTVDAEGYITYQVLHFCEVVISSKSNPITVRIRSAQDLIDALTEIKTDAKQQIPGATGNKQYRVNANFVLENDIVIDGSTQFMYTDSNGAPLHFYGVKGELNLNGHTITVTSDALMSGKAYANAALLFQYSNVTITGNGSIVTHNKSIPVYAWANCTVDIHSGNYVTNASERNESAVYVNNASARVNVYGGTYTNSAYAFNAHDNNCAGTAVIVLHEGITYADFFKSGNNDLIASDIAGGRIVMADNCELVEYEENGVGMNKVVAK